LSTTLQKGTICISMSTEACRAMARTLRRDVDGGAAQVHETALVRIQTCVRFTHLRSMSSSAWVKSCMRNIAHWPPTCNQQFSQESVRAWQQSTLGQLLALLLAQLFGASGLPARHEQGQVAGSTAAAVAAAGSWFDCCSSRLQQFGQRNVGAGASGPRRGTGCAAQCRGSHPQAMPKISGKPYSHI